MNEFVKSDGTGKFVDNYSLVSIGAKFYICPNHLTDPNSSLFIDQLISQPSSSSSVNQFDSMNSSSKLGFISRFPLHSFSEFSQSHTTDDMVSIYHNYKIRIVEIRKHILSYNLINNFIGLIEVVGSVSVKPSNTFSNTDTVVPSLLSNRNEER